MYYSPGGTRQQYVLEEAEAYSQPLSGLDGARYMGFFGESAADPQVAQALKEYQDGIAACQQAPNEAQKADCIRQWEEYKKQLDDYQKQLDAYNAQVAQVRQTQAVQPQAVAESRSLDTGAWQFGPRVSAQQKTLYEAQQQHGQTGQPETWMQKVQRTFQEGKIWSAGSGIGERKVAERLAEQKGAKARAKEAAREGAEARAWGADVAQKMKEQRLLAKTEAKAKEEAAREEAVREAAKEEAREANQKSPQQPKEVPPTQEELKTSQLTRAFAADAARRAALAQQKADEAESYKRRVEQANKPVSPVPSAKQYFGVPYRPLVRQPVENKWAAGQQPFGPGGMMLVGKRPTTGPTTSSQDFSTPGVSASYGMPKLGGFSQLDLEEAVVWGF